MKLVCCPFMSGGER